MNQSWTSFKAAWPPWATPQTHPQLWTGVSEGGWREFLPPKKQERSEDYFCIKAAGWGGCFPFPSPNHVLSCWLGAPQPQTGSGEECRRRTKLEPHRHWQTNRVQKSRIKMSGMIWCQLDGHLSGEFCGVDVAAGQVKGKSKGKTEKGWSSHTSQLCGNEQRHQAHGQKSRRMMHSRTWGQYVG